MKRKYLVMRRDGSVPRWPAFVLAAADPAAPTAMRAYADAAEQCGMPSQYVRDVRDLAAHFDDWRAKNGPGNPGESDRRGDCQFVTLLMEQSR